MGHMPKPQLIGLAMWTYGIVIAKSCGLNMVAATLACKLREKEGNLRQRLREWYWNKEAKKGVHRKDLQPSLSFVPLMRWILSLWQSEEHRIVLAMDATSLKNIYVVLAISIVYRGCAMPVAWKILPQTAPGSWKPHWIQLFEYIKEAIPSGWEVLVMADRGLYAHWLFTAIQKNHWHPFLRINHKGYYRVNGTSEYRPLSKFLSSHEHERSAHVTCFNRNSVTGTLLAYFSPEYKEPWLILSDMSPETATAYWYGMRSWIEGGFKDLKRDGWDWQYTRMIDPERASRYWLALAVATFFVVSIGGEADASLPPSSIDALPSSHIARKTKKPSTKSHRVLSVFSRGQIETHFLLLSDHSVFVGSFYPEPWPLTAST